MKFYEGRGLARVVVGLGDAPRYACGIFAQGYRAAANVVSTHLLGQERFADYDAYPVVFLYRHAFELYLKGIIYESARIAAFNRLAEIDAALYNTHDLEQLARAAATTLRQLFPDDAGLGELMATVAMSAAAFAEIDPDSFAYRYPIDRHGRHATKRHQSIDLDAFHQHMDKLLRDLEVVDFGLDVESCRAQESYEIFDEMLKAWEPER